MEWQPIETAPKDGTEVLVWASWDWDGMEGENCDLPPRWMVARCAWGEFITVTHNPYSDTAVRPTHWMPLPEHPK